MVEEAQTMPPTTVVEGKVDIYVCGVTPYDFSHIGHARAYVASTPSTGRNCRTPSMDLAPPLSS
jgi:hypothetical protein